jgi:putative hydrolase
MVNIERMQKEIECDLHTHTVASGHAFSTLDELARAASDKGLKILGVSDHGPSLPGGAHIYHFWNLKSLPKELYGVRFLKGAEANIITKKGDLDIPEEILAELDFVEAAIHTECGYDGDSALDNTKALIAAAQKPFVDILVHPGNPFFPFEIEPVLEAAKENSVLLEINNSSFLTSRVGSKESCEKIAKALFENGLDVILGSDAHFHASVGRLEKALELAANAGFGKDRIINFSSEKMLEFLNIAVEPTI